MSGSESEGGPAWKRFSSCSGGGGSSGGSASSSRDSSSSGQESGVAEADAAEGRVVAEWLASTLATVPDSRGMLKRAVALPESCLRTLLLNADEMILERTRAAEREAECEPFDALASATEELEPDARD
ncbi:hypothetical protein JKP88DRAFT_350156 [Tribonema minus]|uniref:Uncharacterized protein n=1 Tax=Tribonema minus TaxID=303371 RepID=A0A835YPY3_9STRA|nr:hypothetical protein JKP88DRAFT_350156 [Tribonema minus]